MKYTIDYFCLSHRGNLRSVNQDNFFCLGDYMQAENNGTENTIVGVTESSSTNTFAVFDGMGGEDHGEIAAFIAAKGLSDFISDDELTHDFNLYCKLVNNEICEYAHEHELFSMGTTAAIMQFAQKKIYLCNIGDSKIFRFSDRKIQQISYDHVSISAFGTKPPLSQNLGIKESELIISPYIATGDYQDGDVYLICSDGLTDMVSVEEIKETVLSADKDNAANTLLDRALKNGGKDNITLILLYVQKQRFRSLTKINSFVRCKHGNG